MQIAVVVSEVFVASKIFCFMYDASQGEFGLLP